VAVGVVPESEEFEIAVVDADAHPPVALLPLVNRKAAAVAPELSFFFSSQEAKKREMNRYSMIVMFFDIFFP
jgi:hypothetical protein